MADVGIVLTRGDFAAIHSAVSLATGYGALGKQVHLVLAWGALRKLMRGDFDAVEVDDAAGLDVGAVAAIRDAQLPSQWETLQELRELGLLRVYGCSGSAAGLGYSVDEVTAKVGEVVGATSFLDGMETAELVVI